VKKTIAEVENMEFINLGNGGKTKSSGKPDF
jgi:hypothetical protein